MAADVKMTARKFFSKELELYKNSKSFRDFGEVIDKIVDMGYLAGLSTAEEWCSAHCDADTLSCSVGLRDLIAAPNNQT